MQQPPPNQPPPGYTQYPQQPQSAYPNYQPSPYGQPPYQQPPSQRSPKRKLSKKTWLIIAGVIVALIILSGISNALSGKNNAATDTSTTPVATQGQAQPTTAPTQAPTQAPTKAPVSANIVPTHGSSHLGGNVSDFYGKFGQPMNAPQAGSAPNNKASFSVGWITDANNGYLLSVQYYADTHIVYYLSYTGPSNWSKAQYRDYLIANFAPPGASPDTALNSAWINGGGDPYNPIIYTSSVGNIALHISDGEADMNTL